MLGVAGVRLGRVVFMRVVHGVVALVLAAGLAGAPGRLRAQEPKSANPAAAENAPSYSGMYSFLKEGELVQVTVEDQGHVAGFISRFGDGESDKGEFLNQFFKIGKLDGNKLNFTTDILHGVSWDFKGAVERGEGKNPGAEGYYVLKGTLTQNISDVNKKVMSHSQEVVFKMFPQTASPTSAERK